MLEDPNTELNTRLQDLRELLKQRGSELDPRTRQELSNQIEREREETGVLALKNLQSLQKLEGAPRVRKVLDLLRKYIPKYFFKAANRQLSFNQAQQIMVQFRSEVQGDQVIPAENFADYFANLYTCPQPALSPIPRTQSSAEVIITEGELEAARAKLSRHKAVGVDRLADMKFHNDILWDQIKDKVLYKFNQWALTLRIPSYMK